jgi:hypothetical protein
MRLNLGSSHNEVGDAAKQKTFFFNVRKLKLSHAIAVHVLCGFEKSKIAGHTATVVRLPSF